MDPLMPWLLLMMAALIVACVSLYHQLRQSESQARGQQSVISDELRDAEAALLSALDRLQDMDAALAEREARLRAGPDPPEAVSPSAPERAATAAAIPDGGVNTAPAAPTWRERVVALGRAGLAPSQIARELELPVGEVELVLSLSIAAPGGSAR